jgi:hypothetical protein
MQVRSLHHAVHEEAPAEIHRVSALRRCGLRLCSRNLEVNLVRALYTSASHLLNQQIEQTCIVTRSSWPIGMLSIMLKQVFPRLMKFCVRVRSARWQGGLGEIVATKCM